MARYIPISRRRRNAAIATVIALFVGIALGWLIGKQSAPSVSSAVKDAQQQAADIAIQLERLPIEYEPGPHRLGRHRASGSHRAPRRHPSGGNERLRRRALGLGTNPGGSTRTPSPRSAPRRTRCQPTSSRLPSRALPTRSASRSACRRTARRDGRDLTTEPHARTSTDAQPEIAVATRTFGVVKSFCSSPMSAAQRQQAQHEQARRGRPSTTAARRRRASPVAPKPRGSRPPRR